MQSSAFQPGYYGCKPSGLDVRTLLEVTNATGTHLPGKSNLDVTRIDIIGQTLFYLPTGLKNVFPNLRGIRVFLCGLKAISASDLAPFPLLDELNFPTNDIEVIPADLFAANPNLRYIHFGQNRVKKVGNNLLVNLIPNLIMGEFASNVCINYVGVGESGLNELQSLLNSNCA
jgi:hypothetical protein